MANLYQNQRFLPDPVSGSASVKNSVISNGCLIEEQSKFRYRTWMPDQAGAVIKNSIVLSHTVVGENAHLEIR